MLTAAFALAQVAPAPATDAATLAKYDRNKNGRIDADEVAAMDADAKRAASVVSTNAAGTAQASDEVVSLSPFEVVSDNKGYYGANTMSGTRFNSKLEDLASSITVLTKEQIADFAMLDINDVFLYTASAEGTGNYTDFEVNRNGDVQENVSLNPTQANRVRGIASANVSLGNFETMARVPVDPLGIDAVEVSRGPNASVFGLGNPSGTVNMVPSSANLSRDRAHEAPRSVKHFEPQSLAVRTCDGNERGAAGWVGLHVPHPISRRDLHVGLLFRRIRQDRYERTGVAS